MGIVYTPPSEIDEEDFINHMVFLAGSIEMDKAVNWQTQLSKELEKIPKLTILNPRRTVWDNSWEQKLENPEFRKQVDWELDGIEYADTVIFYFDPNTKSPITLLELGMVSQMIKLEKKLIICCPEGFYRKGNVDIVIDRAKTAIKENYSFPKNGNVEDYILVVDNLEELKKKAVEFLKNKLNQG
jgi:hypothetical protein